MTRNYRNVLIIGALLVIIGVGIYIRSSYIRTDGIYLAGFDPYYHYRMAETILNEGSRPDLDMLSAYPTGAPVTHPPFFHYYLAYSYILIHVFSNITLFQWCIYANIIPIALAVFAAFCAGKALTNDVGGLFTALFMTVNRAISSRTFIGYTDTDMWIVLLSFAGTYFLFTLLCTRKKYWSVFLGFTIFLFAMTWIGYWYFYLLVFAALVLYILVETVKKRSGRDLLSACALCLLSFGIPWSLYEGHYITAVVLIILGIFWVFGEKFFTQTMGKLSIPLFLAVIGVVTGALYEEMIFHIALRNAGKILGLLSPAEVTVKMPDISISVAQRYAVTLSDMAQRFSMLLLLAPLGIIFLIWKRTTFSFQSLVYVGLYFLGTGILLLIGGRYIMLFGIPLILAAGAFFGILPEVLKERVPPRGVLVVGFVCALLVIPCYTGGLQAGRSAITMNDDTWELLTWVNDNIPEDAVIISSWEMGYWIEAIAKRKTVMNGSHYDIQWRVVKYGKIIETTDELVAMKEVYGFNDRSEVEALREFPENSEEIIQKEIQGFAEDNAYLLLDERTIITFYWLSYFGNWNYVTGEGNGRIYNPLYAQGAKKLTSGTEYLYGDQGIYFTVIKENSSFHSFILLENRRIPTMGTLFLKDGVMHFLKREEGELGVVYMPLQSIPYVQGGMEWPDVSSLTLFIQEQDLACMLTRMYFFNGEHLQYFELVKDFGTAKLYKVHRIPQEFEQGIVIEVDTYQPK